MGESCFGEEGVVKLRRVGRRERKREGNWVFGEKGWYKKKDMCSTELDREARLCVCG